LLRLNSVESRSSPSSPNEEEDEVEQEQGSPLTFSKAGMEHDAISPSIPRVSKRVCASYP
jgi:hypothetical protein